MTAHDILANPLFSEADRYTLDQLNEVMYQLARNDDKLRDIVEALQRVLSATPFSALSSLKSPQQLADDLDKLFALEYLEPATNSPAPPDPRTDGPLDESDYDAFTIRFYGEIKAMFAVEPFKSLIEGAKLKPSQWLPLFKAVELIRQLLYWVQDGPNYEVDPVKATKEGRFVTTLTNADGKYLLVNADGSPYTINGQEQYRTLPAGDWISAFEYRLRALEVEKLRKLYRIGAFEAGVPTHFRHADGNDPLTSPAEPLPFPWTTFGWDDGPASPITNDVLPKRYPAGFATPGQLLYLRNNVADYANKIDLKHLIPASGTASAGIAHRMLMEETEVLTPFGVLRIPLSLLRWEHLLNEADLADDTTNGDPVIFVGLHVELGVERRDPQQQTGMAKPATVADHGFDTDSILLLEKDHAPSFTNVPALTGPQKNSLAKVGAWGHQHGQLIGYIQTNEAGPDSQAQFIQVAISLRIQATRAKTLDAYLRDLMVSTLDETADINANSSDVDMSPWITAGLNARLIGEFLSDQGHFAGYTWDPEQLVFHQEDPSTPDPSNDERNLRYILPIGIHLEKNSRTFDFDNLNGAPNRFADGWAIRRISSKQTSLFSVLFDDGTGKTDQFPPDFVGARMRIVKPDGTVLESSIIEQIGDKLARVPEEVHAQIEVGDVAMIDRRVPDESLNATYRNEVNENSFVDLRARSQRFVEPIVTTDDESGPGGSPSPNFPAEDRYPWESPLDWHTLERQKPTSLQMDTLRSVYEQMRTAMETKVRYHQAQRFYQKVGHRYDITDLRVDGNAFKSFLLRWINEFDESGATKEWMANTNLLIHWPDKQEELTGERETVFSLNRFPKETVVQRDDEIRIKRVNDEWGDVPVLVKHWNDQDHFRFPLQVDLSLAFVSERSFSIPGHTRFAGVFTLEVEDHWIPIPRVSFLLEQQKLDGTKEFLGSFEVDPDRADSFTNVEGIFRFDGEASYNPVTRRVSINYREEQNFTLDEPGVVTTTFTYHDLTEIHPLFTFFPATYGLTLSHLHDAVAFKVSQGKEELIEVEVPAEEEGGEATVENLVLRLEGLSNRGGEFTVRWNREDLFKLIAQRGFIRTEWVIRGVPWVTISKVTYDQFGRAIDVAYTVDWIDQTSTTSALITDDDRCQQRYLPCDEKYGWTDITQSQIHTPARSPQASPRFIFYEKKPFVEDGALTFDQTSKAFQSTDPREPVDYRWLTTVSVPLSQLSDFEALTPFALLLNPLTGERRLVEGVFRSATNRGSTVSLEDPLTLSTVHSQDRIYVRRSGDLDASWVLEFAGMLVVVKDTSIPTDEAFTKLAAVGYWYAGHDLDTMAPLTQTFGIDALFFQTDLLTRDVDFWRIGDLPNRYLYRQNNILEVERQQPPVA